MSHLTVVVPSALISPVRDGLLALHEVRTESAHVIDARSLVEIDDALAQLDADQPRPGGAPTTITVDLDVIAIAVHTALLTAAEGVVASCHDFVLPTGDASAITRALSRTVQAHRLLTSLDDQAA